MINWKQIYKLSRHEFPEDPDIFANPELIKRLSTLRKRLGERIFPSPVDGALARLSGSKKSQHYAVGRRSTAVDIFCEGVPIKTYCYILACGFRGVGIYLDTRGPDGNPWVMFHVDIRSSADPIVWFVQKEKQPTGKYKNVFYYPHKNPDYWRFMKDDRLYEKRTYGEIRVP